MGNCLVTKLKGVVDNDELIKIGEAVIRNVSIPGGTSSEYLWRSCKCLLPDDARTTIEIKPKSGHPQFYIGGVPSGTVMTDSWVNAFIASTDDAVFDIIIKNKYDLNTLWLNGISGDLDLSQFKYSNNAGIDGLHSLWGDNNIYNIESFNFSNIRDLSISGANIVGTPLDLSMFANCSRLQIFTIIGPLTGDIANMAGKALTTFEVEASNANIYGDISAFSNSTVTELKFQGVGSAYSNVRLSGDLSTLPSTCGYIGVAYSNYKSTFSWNGTKSGRRLSIIGGENAEIINIDAFLNNEANLEAYTSSFSWENIIDITSPVEPTVPDSVYAAIKSKGITSIVINGVEH